MSMKYQLAIAIAIVQSISAVVFLPAASMAESWQLRRIDRTNAQIYGHNRIRLSQAKKATTLVSFPEVGLTIEQPIGFIKATSFYGFEQSATNSSVMLTKIPGPFSKVTQGFDKSNLATRGISLISKQTVKIDNQQGVLLQVTQSAYGEQFRKWVLVFGNEQSTQIVTATFLNEKAPTIGESLKKIVLAVAPSSPSAVSTTSSLPFTVTAVEGLLAVRAAAGAGKIAAFTKDGNIPLANPTDPLFIVTPSLGDVPVDDRKSFATSRLSNYPQTEITAIASTNEIAIDNLPGWEIIANGRDLQSKSTLKLYQIMLFPKQGGYILMTGIVGDKQSELYLPKFKAMALTYRNSAK
ncbi:hypothetical protein [Chamaesiphon sp. VAR_48_metabat_403]|uniref:hypothetical protein n=1 Tax=Chamaesiphon sp. VAR_48_metabat_403 TaxID=2964700 RepID=UPI00286E791C|nr:hypothetical protein [Chamaesiphon sp. VAR_48_metabat_403]